MRKPAGESESWWYSQTKMDIPCIVWQSGDCFGFMRCEIMPCCVLGMLELPDISIAAALPLSSPRPLIVCSANWHYSRSSIFKMHLSTSSLLSGLTLLASLNASVLALPLESSANTVQTTNPFHESLFSCPAASWPKVKLGHENRAQEPSKDLKKILSQISPRRIEATIRKLVSFGTRHTLSTQANATYGIGAARNWIESEFKRYANASDGRLTVEVVGYDQQPDGRRILFPVRISDVVATLKGEGDPERVYVVSGHYDSINSDVLDYKGIAPGANDEYVHFYLPFLSFSIFGSLYAVSGTEKLMA